MAQLARFRLNADARSPSSPLTSPLSSPPLGACSICRYHKIKCGKELPSCSRCVKRRLLCSYAPRVRRKHPSQETGLSSQSNGDDSASSSATSPDQQQSSQMDFSMSPAGLSMGSVIHAATEIVQDQAKMPEREPALFLIEIYFTRIWNSSLMLDYDKFVRDYDRGILPEYVLLSLFAVSSLFFKPTPSSDFAKQNELSIFSALNLRGRQWANQASQKVLSAAETPSPYIVCAFMNLSLYWFSVGNYERLQVHHTLSQTLARMLPIRGDSGNKDDSPLHCASLGCFINACLFDNDPITQTNQSMSYNFREIDEELSKAVSTGHSRLVAWLMWDKDGLEITAKSCLQLLGIWKDIKDLIRCMSNDSRRETQSKIQRVYVLESWLQKTWAAIPEALKDGVVDDTVPERKRRNTFWLHSIYQLCLIYLHSSVIPALCKQASFDTVSSTLVRLSAKSALKNATKFSEMVQSYLSTKPDFTRMPALVAYCAFIAGGLHGTIGQIKQIITGTPASKIHAFVCLVVLEEMSSYWTSADGMRQALRAQFPRGPEVEDLRSMLGSCPNLPTLSDDLEEEIITHLLNPGTEVLYSGSAVTRGSLRDSNISTPRLTTGVDKPSIDQLQPYINEEFGNSQPTVLIQPRRGHNTSISDPVTFDLDGKDDIQVTETSWSQNPSPALESWPSMSPQEFDFSNISEIEQQMSDLSEGNFHNDIFAMSWNLD